MSAVEEINNQSNIAEASGVVVRFAGDSGDGVGFEEDKFLFVWFDPQFEDGFFLEGANEDGGAPGELIFLEELYFGA